MPSSPSPTKAAVAEIERCAQAGLKGVGEMRPDMQLFDLSDEMVIDPFVEALNHHRLILLTHASEPVGHKYQGKGGITPDILYPFIAAHPQLTIVCAHWGGGLPFYNLMPEVKEAMKNVYFDTAASPFLYSPDVYNQVIQLVGADKVLFGSDYPLLPPRRLLEEIEALDLNQETKELMLSGNALQASRHQKRVLDYGTGAQFYRHRAPRRDKKGDLESFRRNSKRAAGHRSSGSTPPTST